MADGEQKQPAEKELENWVPERAAETSFTFHKFLEAQQARKEKGDSLENSMFDALVDAFKEQGFVMPSEGDKTHDVETPSEGLTPSPSKSPSTPNSQDKIMKG